MSYTFASGFFETTARNVPHWIAFTSSSVNPANCFAATVAKVLFVIFLVLLVASFVVRAVRGQSVL